MSKQQSAESFVDRIKTVMEKRSSDYAHPQDNHQLTADMFELWWKSVCQHKVARGEQFAPKGRIPFTAEDICVFNIIQKLSRISFATHDDSLLDIVGYAENIAMLRSEQRNIKRVPEVPEMTPEELNRLMTAAREGFPRVEDPFDSEHITGPATPKAE